MDKPYALCGKSCHGLAGLAIEIQGTYTGSGSLIRLVALWIVLLGLLSARLAKVISPNCMYVQQRDNKFLCIWNRRSARDSD